MSEENSEVQTLIKKAAEAVEPLAAMQYSQAAVNAANALRTGVDMREAEKRLK